MRNPDDNGTMFERYGEGAGDIAGQLVKHTSLGCYPVFYVDSEGCVLCADCANATEEDSDDEKHIVDAGGNWEDPDLFCDVCCARIESAYAEPEEK